MDPRATTGGISAEDLKAERDRYVALAFCWADLLFEVDRQLNIAFAAGALDGFFGRSAKDLIGRPFFELIAPADSPLVSQLLKQLQKTGRVHDEQIRVVDGRQSLLWMSLSAYCLDPLDGVIYLALQKSTPAARSSALSVPRDEATGLFDSASFAELAAKRLKKIADAGERAEITLMSMPEIPGLLDRLDQKENAALLHRVGDVLKASSIAGDSAAAVGTGKFSIMHSVGCDVGDLTNQIERLTRTADPTERGVAVEAATFAVDAETIDEADLTNGLIHVLRKFNSGTANSVKSLASSMTHLIDEARAEISDFKQVVSDADFHVVVQPIIEVASGDIHHYEALCRFDKNPSESPFKTITFAEEAGLIHEFDLAMVKKVIEWLGKFPRNSDRYRVAVNVSGYSIGQPSYLDALLRLLGEQQWTKGKLLFEITESARMSNLEHANKFIQTLRQRGYQVCLDDFGAGAASFQYLSVLEVDLVKLDGSAIRNAQRAQKGRAFLTALTELCRRMSVGTVAEMVDTHETLRFVRACGCDYVQGYLFGKPSPDVKDFAAVKQAFSLA